MSRGEMRGKFITTGIALPLGIIVADAFWWDWSDAPIKIFWIWATLLYIWFVHVRRAFPVDHEAEKEALR